MNKLKAIKFLAAINILLSLISGLLNYNINERNSDIFENLMSITNEQINMSHIFASTTQQSIELLAFSNSFRSQQDISDGKSLREKEKLFNKKISDYNNNNDNLNNYLNQASKKIENRLAAINENKYKRAVVRDWIIILNILIMICSIIILYIEADSQNDFLMLSNKLNEIKKILSYNDTKYKKN